MKRNSILTAVTLAALAAASVSTASFAQQGPGTCVQGSADCPRGPGAGMGQGKGMVPGDGMGMMPGRGMMPGLDFDTLDTDKDGRLTRQEMDAQRQSRVSTADTNGDGLLSAEELTALELARMTTRAEAQAKRMVERFDSDGDGLLSAAELADGPRPMAAMFDRIDADGDGALSKEEADAARARMEDRMQDRKGPRGGHHHRWFGRD